MSSREHSRFEIWNAGQHPYKHVLEDFSYTNPALPPGSTTLKTAVDSLFAVLYPQSKPSVATPAALPLAGNVINDMRVVSNDGDGKAASYRWEQREGEAVPSWHKIYDVDFGADSVLQAWQIKTQDVYVSRYGYDDRDGAGLPVTGMLAGQTVYGGASANTNLTLFANSGDGTGPATGYVQLADPLRPLTDNALDLGTALRRFKDLRLGGSLYVGSMSLTSGSITDTSLAISFGAVNLTSTGNATFNKVTAVGAASVFATGTTVGTLTLASGAVTDSSGAISFAAVNLTTTGFVRAGTLTIASGSITDTSLAISFGASSLTTTGAVSALTVAGTTSAQGGNLRLAANTLSAQDLNGSITLAPNGTGTVAVAAAMTTGAVTSTGIVTVTGQLNADDLRLDGDTLSNTALNGSVQLAPNGTGDVLTTKRLRPSTNNTIDLGAATARWATFYLGTAISDGTTNIASATLQSFRDANVGVAAGMSLFWDGTKWTASAPDTEITHGTISGLTADDHAQYALLAGRAGGQALVGGTAASQNLDLESTAHATKGSIRVKNTTIAFTDASYSLGVWSGIDLGGAFNRFRHVYSAGEFFGLRTENVGALPVASSQRVGRLVFLTTDNHLYVDVGTSLLKVGDTNRFQTDTAWNGLETTKNVTVTTVGMDARQALWQLRDNTNNFEQVHASITATSATNVLITTNIALPTGSYRLVGLE